MCSPGVASKRRRGDASTHGVLGNRPWRRRPAIGRASSLSLWEAGLYIGVGRLRPLASRVARSPTHESRVGPALAVGHDSPARPPAMFTCRNRGSDRSPAARHGGALFPPQWRPIPHLSANAWGTGGPSGSLHARLIDRSSSLSLTSTVMTGNCHDRKRQDCKRLLADRGRIRLFACKMKMRP